MKRKAGIAVLKPNRRFLLGKAGFRGNRIVSKPAGIRVNRLPISIYASTDFQT